MTEGSVLTDEVKRLIGSEGKREVVEIEKGMIKKVAKAIGDDNPLWTNEEYAIQMRYGSIIAPPSLAFAAKLGALEDFPEVPTPHLKGLEGGAEWEFYQPLRPGDVITISCKFADAYERDGKAGKMLFLVFETSLFNQDEELVVRSKTTLIRL